MSDTPRIIWPAPGLPVLLESREQFTLLVAHDGLALADLGSWAQKLCVRERAGRSSPLCILGIEAAERRDIGSLAHGYAALAEAHRLYWAKIAVRLTSPFAIPAPRRSAVLDIVHDDQVVRP